jgi:hypothetical protein
MRGLPKRSASVTFVGLSAALAFAALASVGSAVSPTSPSAGVTQYPEKVTICHRTKSKKNPYVTIRVSRNAVPAHLRHGDGIGRSRSRRAKAKRKRRRASSKGGGRHAASPSHSRRRGTQLIGVELLELRAERVQARCLLKRTASCGAIARQAEI